VDVVLPRLHALVAEATTGVVWLRGTAAHLRVELVAGWVHAFAAIDPPADAEQVAAAARAAARARPHPDATAAFRARVIEAARAGAGVTGGDDPRVRLGATTPFHPTRALRLVAQTALAELDALDPVDAALEGALSIERPLHSSALDPDEHRLGQLLAQHGLPLPELLTRAGCPPPRTLALLRELAALGALRAAGRAIAIDLFGLVARDRTEAAERRRRYHAEARKVHPDLQPEADAERREHLTREMAELAQRQKKER
jgi:hypothetical protein